jgi:hypothetical protein
MAFKMKGSPMYRNFGIGSLKKKGDDVKEMKSIAPDVSRLMNDEDYRRDLKDYKDDIKLGGTGGSITANSPEASKGEKRRVKREKRRAERKGKRNR